jgi:hypothetical protein
MDQKIIIHLARRIEDINIAMTGTLILDSNNLNPTGVFNASTTPAPYNTFTQNMRGLNLSGRKIGLRKMYIYYSWANIMNGTTLTISWASGTTYTDYVWTIPAKRNYADVSQLNQALQDFCIANGLYLINGTSNVYFLELVANANSYKIELNLFKIPTSAGTYTQPSNFAGFPTVSKTPKFTIPTGSEICDLIGFAAGTYDGGTTAAQFVSSYVPQFQPVSCIYITCNVAKNDVPINGSTVIASFTTRGAEYGSMITVETQASMDWYEIDTNSNLLEVRLWTQNWQPLYCQDPQTMIQLSVS